jgi:dephospho-CoA kinase
MQSSLHRPVVIGLTGGIGSGKSAVLKVLVALGAEGVDADRVAHEVMARGGPAYQPILSAFGRAIVTAEGQIDRPALARRVFADAVALRRLEAITHPAVAEVVSARVAASKAPVVVIEAIKLLEAGLSRALCDQVWVTVARPEQQMARLIAGRGMSPAEVERRVAAQMPPAEMTSKADRVLDTSGTLAETGLQVFKAWADLKLPFLPAEIRPATGEDAEGIAAVLNGIVREGGLTVVDRTYSVDEEKKFLDGLDPRASLTVATVAGHVIAFVEVDLYATYAGAMNHVGTMGTFVAAGLRGQGIGRLLAYANFASARAAGFLKIVINVRADNSGAQHFYSALGFQPCGRLVRQAFVDGHYVDELLYELFL